MLFKIVSKQIFKIHHIIIRKYLHWIRTNINGVMPIQTMTKDPKPTNAKKRRTEIREARARARTSISFHRQLLDHLTHLIYIIPPSNILRRRLYGIACCRVHNYMCTKTNLNFYTTLFCYVCSLRLWRVSMTLSGVLFTYYLFFLMDFDMTVYNWTYTVISNK